MQTDQLTALLPRSAPKEFNAISMEPSAAYPAEINDRLPRAILHATEQCKKVPSEVQHRVLQLLDVAVRAPTSSKRVTWHKRAASALGDAYGAFSACKQGCSHCCHIPVRISSTEARVLGRTIGRPPCPPLLHAAIPENDKSACTFLVQGECSIYEARPAVCRAHLNMDVDDLLCRALPSGTPVPVPFLDTRMVIAASLAISGPSDIIADLRQWFPINKNGSAE